MNLSHIMNTELEHTHVTFTIPGTIAKLLFERSSNCIIAIPYRKIRFIWKNTFLKHLHKQNIINDEEKVRFTDIYKNGFHVYFQPITGDCNDKLYRTAEYIATGYFHNSQIQEINHEKRTITFKYKKMVDRGSRKKHFSYKTMSIFEFMVGLHGRAAKFILRPARDALLPS
ncbi:MAG: transposase [Spirochaetes bacterium]|nr:transposase [Spirochaetota bacterium]